MSKGLGAGPDSSEDEDEKLRRKVEMMEAQRKEDNLKVIAKEIEGSNEWDTFLGAKALEDGKRLQ